MKSTTRFFVKNAAFSFIFCENSESEQNATTLNGNQLKNESFKNRKKVKEKQEKKNWKRGSEKPLTFKIKALRQFVGLENEKNKD